MVLHITDSNRLRLCPHCGGRLYWDQEDREWHCLNCGRQPERSVSTTDNLISGKKTPVSSADNPQATSTLGSKLAEQSTPLDNKSKQNSQQKTALRRAKIYEGHSIDGPWWPPREITFRRRQMLFLIKNLPQLREGYWPANPAESGYNDLPGIKKGRAGRHHAYFEIPASIAAEVETRLEQARIDGLILEAIECWGKSEESMARYFRMPVWSIRKRAKNALRYISGWERKKQS